MDTRFMFMKKNVPREVVGYVHANDHNIQTSSRKPVSQSKPNFMWSIVRKGE